MEILVSVIVILVSNVIGVSQCAEFAYFSFKKNNMQCSSKVPIKENEYKGHAYMNMVRPFVNNVELAIDSLFHKTRNQRSRLISSFLRLIPLPKIGKTTSNHPQFALPFCFFPSRPRYTLNTNVKPPSSNYVGHKTIVTIMSTTHQNTSGISGPLLLFGLSPHLISPVVIFAI